MSYLGENTKKLGFGLMRLPKKDGVSDVEETSRMVDLFMEAGFTYFDTAWAYGDSEATIKKALVDRYPRESYTLASKNAAWIKCNTREDAIAQFETSLKNTGAGYFDFYLLHNLGENRTHYFDDFDMWSFVKQMKEEGKIRHIGFSFHSTPEELEEILKAHPEAEFVQLQINYADWENPEIQSKGVYEMARKYNKPVVIMEPVKGGNLANPPKPVAEVLKTADPNSSYASWAIRFAASLEGVITVLSGMSNVAQMEDNLSYMKDFKGLSDDQKSVIARAQEELKKIPLIPCTACNYCAKVCPMNIGISGSFAAMNMFTLYQNKEAAAGRYDWNVIRHNLTSPKECIECHSCSEVCPQHISIPEELKKVTEFFNL